MLFNDPRFFVFLLLVVGCLLWGRQDVKKLTFLIASYVFYGCWNWRFLSLLMFSTFMDYYLANAIDRETRATRRRMYVTVSIVISLTILVFFKYCNFFVDSLAALLSALGMSPHIATLQIVLPVGVSFYTFQSMAYVIDVYRRSARPATSLLDFTLYVAFFPQLVAGPIERPAHLLSQIQRFNGLAKSGIKSGLLLMFMGYVKKVAISDNIAPTVDLCFAHFGQMGSFSLLTGLVLFSFQIYFDFSGYSDIARGLAKLFGIDLMINFNQPYFSTNLSEFWLRWHISLSSWLRDYLYIPLGGNRGGRWRTRGNLMTTMLLGGLWHGANWSFVVWGALHGTYLILQKAFSFPAIRPSGVMAARCLKVGKMAVCYACVLLAWLPFRSVSIVEAAQYLKGILVWTGTVSLSDALKVTGGFAALLAFDLPAYLTKDHLFLARLPRWLLVNILFVGGLAVVLTMVLRAGTVRPFFYFQF